MSERLFVNGRETCLYRTHGPLNLSPETNRDATVTAELNKKEEYLTLAALGREIIKRIDQDKQKDESSFK